LEKLGLFSLERRRLRGGGGGDLIEIYKIIRGGVDSQKLFPPPGWKSQLLGVYKIMRGTDRVDSRKLFPPRVEESITRRLQDYEGHGQSG